ncbi:hypothetical protein ACT6P6_01955 [Priestia endophytica]
MSNEEIAQLIFENRSDVEAIIHDPKAFNIHESILEYGLSTRKILYIDYKGEQGNEIVNYVLDYEYDHNVELASQKELEALGGFQYELLPEKISETNKIISRKQYGLFTYPTSGDFYALFIAKLEKKAKLLQVNLLQDERIPPQENHIKYYS